MWIGIRGENDLGDGDDDGDGVDRYHDDVDSGGDGDYVDGGSRQFTKGYLPHVAVLITYAHMTWHCKWNQTMNRSADMKLIVKMSPYVGCS